MAVTSNGGIHSVNWRGVYRYWAVLLVLIAGWPVWCWYVARITDGSDEPIGLLALVTWFVSLALIRKTATSSSSPSYLSVGLAFSYAVLSWLAVPMLLQAGCILLLLMSVLKDLRIIHLTNPGVLGLAMLSLPLISSLEFFIGYPMRVMASHLTAVLLEMNGFVISLSGVTLGWAGRELVVDAPCSGVKMLWTGFWATSLAIVVFDVGWGRGMALYLLTLPCVLIINALRASTLFYTELVVQGLPEWTHTAAGVMAFALYCITLVWIIMKWSDCSWSQNRTFVPPVLS